MQNIFLNKKCDGCKLVIISDMGRKKEMEQLTRIEIICVRSASTRFVDYSRGRDLHVQHVDARELSGRDNGATKLFIRLPEWVKLNYQCTCITFVFVLYTS